MAQIVILNVNLEHGKSLNNLRAIDDKEMVISCLDGPRAHRVVVRTGIRYLAIPRR
jgi:hypothetical protein